MLETAVFCYILSGFARVAQQSQDDIQRMLKIESVTVKAGEVENAMVSVETVIVPPTE